MERDILKRSAYAKKIAEEIENKYTEEESLFLEKKKKDNERENMVFAISGKWGEGKTTLLNSIEKFLIKKNFTVILFNPWKYAEESIALKRAFLKTIKIGLNSEVDLSDLYSDKTQTNIDFFVAFKNFLVFLFVIFILIPVFTGDTFTSWKTTVIEKQSSGLLLAFVTIILKSITIQSKNSRISTAEQFEEKFKELLLRKKKIVIFIDDLDRCNIKTVKIILDSLKTFFRHQECSYIITGDHTIIENYAAKELRIETDISKSPNLEEGRRFLKKLFDVYWRLPLSTPKQFSNFIDDEIKKSKILFSKDSQKENLKQFLSDDDLFERNPRNVKRFLQKIRFTLDCIYLRKEELEKNSKKSELNNNSIISLEKIIQNIDLLVKIFLIEEFFYPVYEKLIIHPEEIIQQEKFLRQESPAGTLSISGKPILDLLDGDQARLQKYSSIIDKEPKFTDKKNTVIKEVSNYFAQSGSTGLPSTLGPDLSMLADALKRGEAVNEFKEVLKIGTPKENNRLLSRQSLITFQEEETTSEEKLNIMKESLIIANEINEWAEDIEEWTNEFKNLTDGEKNQTVRQLLLILLKKRPKLIEKVIETKNDSKDLIWNILIEEKDNIKLHKNTAKELLPLVKNSLEQSPPILKPAVALNSFSPTVILELKKLLIDPEQCKIYIEALEGQDKSLSINLTKVITEKLESFLITIDKIDWIVTNKEFLKKINSFEKIQKNLLTLSKKTKNISIIAQNVSNLEFPKDDLTLLRENIIMAIPSEISLINDQNIQSLLDKSEKIKIFEVLTNIFSSSSENQKKRLISADNLVKSSSFWSNVEAEDIQVSIKKISAIKTKNNKDFVSRKKAILSSWNI